jgi:hypothetical protein
LHPWLTKANFFDFFGGDTVAGNVVNAILWPDKFMNFHAADCTATVTSH